jgi:hypothetical protein
MAFRGFQLKSMGNKKWGSERELGSRLDERSRVTEDGPQTCWWGRHAVPLLGLLAIVVAGMAYSLFWNRLFYHSSNWVTPGDLWSTYRASQYVVWDGEGQIYNNPAAFQTFPGIAIILAPVAKLAGILHLSEGFGMALPRPTTWWILGPIEMALGATLLLPLDKLARRLCLAPRRRIVLVALESTLIWPSVAIWGHPEDALSLALALYGLLATWDGASHRAGVFFGLAIVVQPLVLLLVPIVAAFIPIKRWAILAVEMLSPSVLLFLPPLIQEWGPTTRVLLKQPNYIAPNHPTPWASLAPVLDPAHVETVSALKHVRLANGHFRAIEVMIKVHTMPVVAAGPGRILAVVIACVIGILIKVRKPSGPQLIWLVALALSLRCAFEPVMVPYYLLPGLALVLVVASIVGTIRFSLVCAAAAVCTWLSYFHFSPWDYYISMMLPLLVALVLSWPRSDVATTPLSNNPQVARLI